MIRINLLPVRQVKKVQAGQRQLLIFFAFIAAVAALIYSTSRKWTYYEGE